MIKSSLVSTDTKNYKRFNFISGASESEDLSSGEEVNTSITQTLNVGDCALVPFAGKKFIKHFAQQIIAKRLCLPKIMERKVLDSFFKENHLIRERDHIPQPPNPVKKETAKHLLNLKVIKGIKESMKPKNPR
ncbi:hypothetical protein AVEN_1386-1 [Araneus ventricosus]|uniref:Uncharacterized protein n=1 Tax=Araneus ventricosus TaxID=182803 RepID=A0A4Y2KTK4_ARAVE|nr:hypothetical protein AVEN_1386-1 [Araneus ventricosus]